MDKTTAAFSARLETVVRAIHAFIEERFPDEEWPLLGAALGVSAFQLVASGPDDPTQVEEAVIGYYVALKEEVGKALDVRRRVDELDTLRPPSSVN